MPVGGWFYKELFFLSLQLFALDQTDLSSPAVVFRSAAFRPSSLWPLQYLKKFLPGNLTYSGSQPQCPSWLLQRQTTETKLFGGLHFCFAVIAEQLDGKSSRDPHKILKNMGMRGKRQRWAAQQWQSGNLTVKLSEQWQNLVKKHGRFKQRTEVTLVATLRSWHSVTKGGEGREKQQNCPSWPSGLLLTCRPSNGERHATSWGDGEWCSQARWSSQACQSHQGYWMLYPFDCIPRESCH